MSKGEGFEQLLKRYPIVIGFIFGFMFGFILATIMFKLGVNPPPEPFTDYAENFMAKYPMVVFGGLILLLIVVAFLIISQVKFWISGYLQFRRAWKRKKRRDAFKKYGLIIG